MKHISLISVFSFILITAFIPSKKNNNIDCKAILDSANAFVQTSRFAVNVRPTNYDNERNLRLDKWLMQLSFKEFECLLNAQSIAVKAVGFLYAAGTHQDSLLKNYSFMLNDTTTVVFMMADGSNGDEMKLGGLLSTMLQEIKTHDSNYSKRPEIEKAVIEFILRFAANPASYKSHLFPVFSMGSGSQEGTTYNITHEYEIKNNKGKLVNETSAFVFNENFRIEAIEKDSSRFISADPPKLDYWLKEFGRKLTKADSIELRLR